MPLNSWVQVCSLERTGNGAVWCFVKNEEICFLSVVFSTGILFTVFFFKFALLNLDRSLFLEKDLLGAQKL